MKEYSTTKRTPKPEQGIVVKGLNVLYRAWLSNMERYDRATRYQGSE